MIMRKIILASASPRRKELLEKAGVEFVIRTEEGEEKTSMNEPSEAVKELSWAKAEAVADGFLGDPEEGSLIIGADTVVAFENRILGKPRDREDAVETLLKLQGKTHQVYTGVAVLVRKRGQWIPHIFSECTDVTFYPVSRQEILEYVETGEPMDKAGSYGIQGLFGIYVKSIRGDYSNVVGLPVPRLLYEMKKLGINIRR